MLLGGMSHAESAAYAAEVSEAAVGEYEFHALAAGAVAQMAGHGCGFEVIERDGSGMATVWLATCKCKERFTGGTYEESEDKWRRHVHDLTGTAPNAMGSQTGRWSA